MKKNKFIISEMRSIEDYKTVSINGGWNLHYQQDIKLLSFTKNARKAFLIGRAWQCIPWKRSPEDILLKYVETEELDSRYIEQEKLSWGGSFVIIVNETIYTDAFSSIPIFCSRDGISNDIELLALFGDKAVRRKQLGKMNWYPAPGTGIDGINRLLPSQAFDFMNGFIVPVDLAPNEEWAENNRISTYREDAINEFNTFSSHMLNNIYKSMKEEYDIIVPLSGGYDSRMILSECMYANIPVSAFTFITKDMMLSEIDLPSVVAEELGIRYETIEEEDMPYADNVAEKYKQYTHEWASEKEKTYCARGMYEELSERHGGILLLRGGSVISNPYSGQVKGKFDENDICDIYGIDKKDKAPIKEYFMWCREFPEKDISLETRFFWEQEIGVKAANTEYGFGIYDDVESIMFMNCALLTYLQLKAAPKGERDKYARDLQIQSTCPQLSDIPFAGESTKEKVLDILLKFIEKCKVAILNIRKRVGDNG